MSAVRLAVPEGAWATPPVVRLTATFRDPLANAMATAKTCYSSGGIIDADAVGANYAELAQDLYRSGHHTTLQHMHFQFAIERVSRHCVWSFLHAHPFYNSEQVSQRFVKMRPDTAAVPPLEGRALERYQACVGRQMAAYTTLRDGLFPVAAEAYVARFPNRDPAKKSVRIQILKKTQEVARYVAPVASWTYLYHTVSGVTLLRYARLCDQYDTPTETKLLVRAMVDAVLAEAPDLAGILEEPLPLEATPEAQYFDARPDDTLCRDAAAFRREFDVDLDGGLAVLVSEADSNEAVVASAVREVLGAPAHALSDDQALELVLDPAQNTLHGENLRLGTLSKLTRALVHAHYVFRKVLSHTGDSQDQRHRMTPGSRPVLLAHLADAPDYLTPPLVDQVPEMRQVYEDTMTDTWRTIAELRREGVAAEYAAYLLPNAVRVRFTESTDYLNLHHKHAMRLCYNAQEEIWRASLQEARAVMEVNPVLGSFLLPPCSHREQAGTRPICPEGARYCGVKVWRLGLDEYARAI